MTGPEGPGDEDWGFPEVDPAGPSSTTLPPPELPTEEIVYDTGSDAWWRAQAEAQRASEDAEPEPEPEPLDVRDPSPLDRDWVPANLAELRTAMPEPEPELDPEPLFSPEPVAAEPAASEPVASEPVASEPVAAEPGVAEPVAAEPVEVPVEAAAAVVTTVPRTRPPYTTGQVSRRRRVFGAALALTGVLLGVGALEVFNNTDDKGSPTVALPPSPTTRPSPTIPASIEPSSAGPTTTVSRPPVIVTGASPTPAPFLPVSVLNNSKQHGLAARAASRFASGGWPIRLTGNYRGGVLSETTVYYAVGQQASALRFAKQFGIPRVKPRFAGLPTEGMTVVLTRDFS